jgi:Ras-related protein Rab-1A
MIWIIDGSLTFYDNSQRLQSIYGSPALSYNKSMDSSQATLFLLKITILGDGNVGKTSLVRRFCEGKFESSRVMTIGVDFQTKIIILPDLTAKLSIWDVAGQDRFQAVRENFYRGSRAAALVYDLTRPDSFLNLPRWYDEIIRIVPGIPFIVVGNKLDLVQGGGTTRDGIGGGEEYAKSINAPHLRTSAKTGEGAGEMFEILARLASKKPKL